MLTADAAIMPDGARLPLRQWRPEGESKAVILAVHGFNDYSNAFAIPAAVWKDAGIHVYAYDQRGYGETATRGYWPGTDTMVADLIDIAGLVRARHPDLPLVVLGESMGGAVTMTAAVRAGLSGLSADRLVLIAPAVWGRETMPWWQRWTLDFMARSFPWLELTGRGVRRTPSDNVEMLRAMGRDPLVIKATRVDTIWGLTNLMDAARAAAPEFTYPALIVYGAKEEIIPPGAWRSMVERLPKDGDWTLAVYDTGYHMLLRDLSGDRVVRDVAQFVLTGDSHGVTAEQLNGAGEGNR